MVSQGLEGVMVAETRTSRVEGERGALTLAGWPVEVLARAPEWTVEALAGALLEVDTGVIARAIAAGRAAAWEQRGRVRAALESSDGMDALRGALGTLRSSAGGSAVEEAGAVIGAIAVLAAAWWRGTQGQEPVAPDPALPHAGDYLRMCLGDFDAPEADAMRAYLVTVADHGMNASTFAARVVASTGSDLVSSVVAALGALKGPLHGGAPGPVLAMLDAIGAPERAPDWIEAELDAGRRIMGMGHRVYKVRDPRAAVLEEATGRLSAPRARRRIALARAVEGAATEALERRKPGRRLRANVEFYTAVLLDALGLSPRQFTPTFAVGRVVGWCAHVAEQRRDGRLIRPRASYVGPMYS